MSAVSRARSSAGDACLLADRARSGRAPRGGRSHRGRDRLRRVGSRRRSCVEAGELLVTPGVVDSHVHINEPGRTEWEGFATATGRGRRRHHHRRRHAAQLHPRDDLARTPRSRSSPRSTGSCHVDVAFWGGVVPGQRGRAARPGRVRRPGRQVLPVPVGRGRVPARRRAPISTRAMPVLRDLGLTLLVHAELPGPLDAAEAELSRRARRPARVRDLPALAPQRRRGRGDRDGHRAVPASTAAPAHIVHLSSASALPLHRAGAGRGRADHAPRPACTTSRSPPRRSPDGATQFKCAPPIREADNRERLWEGLEGGALGDGRLRSLALHAGAQEAGDAATSCGAWGGIAGLQLGLSVLWTPGARARPSTSRRSFRVEQRGPGRGSRASATARASLARGYDADIVIWDDAATLHPRARRSSGTGTRSRLTRGARCGAWCSGRGCVGGLLTTG